MPDVFLRLDVRLAEDWWAKENRSYFFWEFGGPPDVVIEIVSNKEGGEDTRKLREYARIKVQYYVIYDPERLLSQQTLRVYELRGRAYQPVDPIWLPDAELGLTLWQGIFEDGTGEWLRWLDRAGNLIPTGAERAGQERARAEQAESRAAEAESRAERLAARLRELGLTAE